MQQPMAATATATATATALAVLALVSTVAVAAPRRLDCDPALPSIPRGRSLPDGSFLATGGVRLPSGTPWPHCGDEPTRVPSCDVPGSPAPSGTRLGGDGSLLGPSGHASRWLPGRFWVDEPSNTLAVCACVSPPCILKCCPPDQVMNLTDEKCVRADDVQSNRTLFLDRFTLLSLNTCHFGKYMLSLDDPGDAYHILPSGFLVLNESREKYLKSDFCLEYTTEKTYVIRAFVCFPAEVDEIVKETKLFLYPLFMIVSEPLLLATFLVYALVPELRNLHGLVIMSHVSSLFFAYLTLLVVQLSGAAMPYKMCVVSAFIIYFAFLASFFWLNVMCLDIWWTFSGFRPLRGSVKEREHKKFVIYSLYCWGSPLLMLIICLIMDLHPGIPETYEKPGFGEKKCWFRSTVSNLIYFNGPIAILIVCNIVLFILTAIKICQVKRGAKILKKQDSRRHYNEEENNTKRFNLYLKLFLVMGVNWIMEVVSFAAGGPDEWWYVTDIANTLQGVLIFIIFVWKQRIRRLLGERFCPSRFPNTNSMTNSSTRMTAIRRNGSEMSSGRSSLKTTQEGQPMKVLPSAPAVRSDDSDAA